jgi:hypothetical protein
MQCKSLGRIGGMSLGSALASAWQGASRLERNSRLLSAASASRSMRFARFRNGAR